LSRLTGGIGWKVLSVNTHRPLFWFLGGAAVTSMADLRGRRLAVHAAHTAPVVSPGSCCASTAWTLLVPWNVSCGLRGIIRWTYNAFGTAPSTPPTSAARSHPNRSPRRRVPTPGLGRRSLPDPYCGHRRGPRPDPARQPGVAGAGAGQQAGPSDDRRAAPLAVDYVASFLDRLTHDEAQRYYERYIGPYFSADSQVDLNIARQAIAAVAAELGVASVAADEIYQPAQ
jgi:hypothetical protein